MGGVVCRRLVGAVLTLLLVPAWVWSWGCEGHQAVALIAEKHMTAHALKMANALLRSQPSDPALPRFCSSQGLGPMADSSTWADDVRKVREETGPWHYIDIPRDAPPGGIARYCRESCVVSAIARQSALLRSRETAPGPRAEALRFLIHLVGDVHQPLHCVSNNDMGGNCLPVAFFGNLPLEKNLQSESYSPNLHGIWDFSLIQHLKGQESVTQWAAMLDRQFRARETAWEAADRKNWTGAPWDDWAWESHAVADSVAYRDLPVAVLVEKPATVGFCGDDNHVSTRLLKLHEQVLQPYVDAVAVTVDGQIVRAGVRLAMVLNQVWP